MNVSDAGDSIDSFYEPVRFVTQKKVEEREKTVELEQSREFFSQSFK